MPSLCRSSTKGCFSPGLQFNTHFPENLPCLPMPTVTFSLLTYENSHCLSIPPHVRHGPEVFGVFPWALPVSLKLEKANNQSLCPVYWRRKWQSTPVLSPGKSHGQKSLVGYISPWGHKESDTTEWLNMPYVRRTESLKNICSSQALV